MNCSAVIVAAGDSTRMGSNKQFIRLLDKPLLFYTLNTFINNCDINEIVIVLKDEHKQIVRNEILSCFNTNKIINIVSGGPTRQHSVYNGLLTIKNKNGIVLIHDGARPFVSDNDISNVIQDAINHHAAVLSVKVVDTIKSVDKDGFVFDSLDRSTLWSAQTPQAFDYNILMEAYSSANIDNYIATDDATLVERIGVKAKITCGNYNNIKITTPLDLIIANAIISNIYNKPTNNCPIDNLDKSKEIEIYTDGACSHNPGKGGYGAVLLYNGTRKELSGGFKLTTNNRMEILAVIKGLEILKKESVVKLYSDSKYVVDAIVKGWVYKWQKNNWMRNSKEKALNVDLWQRLLPLLEKHKVTFIWVKGHNANVENERCDFLATSFIQNGNLEDDVNYNKSF